MDKNSKPAEDMTTDEFGIWLMRDVKRLLPDCPECGTDNLYVAKVDKPEIRCYACNWSSGPIESAGMDMMTAAAWFVLEFTARKERSARLAETGGSPTTLIVSSGSHYIPNANSLILYEPIMLQEAMQFLIQRLTHDYVGIPSGITIRTEMRQEEMDYQLRLHCQVTMAESEGNANESDASD